MVRSLALILLVIFIFSFLPTEAEARHNFTHAIEGFLKILFFSDGKLGIGTEKPMKKLDVVGGIKTDELCIGDKCFAAVCKTSGGWLFSETKKCPIPATGEGRAETAGSSAKLTITPVALDKTQGRPRIPTDSVAAMTLSVKGGSLTVRVLTFELSGRAIVGSARFPVELINSDIGARWLKSEIATCIPLDGNCRVSFGPGATINNDSVNLKILVDATLFNNAMAAPDPLIIQIINDYDIVLKPGALGSKMKFPLEVGRVEYD